MKARRQSGMADAKVALLLAATVLITAIASPYLLKVLEKADHRDKIKRYRNSADYLYQLETSWERKECEHFDDILTQIKINIEFGLEAPDEEKLQLYRIVRTGACTAQPKTPE